jgi:hypothetical protein
VADAWALDVFDPSGAHMVHAVGWIDGEIRPLGPQEQFTVTVKFPALQAVSDEKTRVVLTGADLLGNPLVAELASPVGATAVPSQEIRVVATKRGYDGVRLIEPGERFTITWPEGKPLPSWQQKETDYDREHHAGSLKPMPAPLAERVSSKPLYPTLNERHHRCSRAECGHGFIVQTSLPDDIAEAVLNLGMTPIPETAKCPKCGNVDRL